jgi:hypothetical protein
MPSPPAKPADSNVLSNDLADFMAEFTLWATECEAKNDELAEVLKPAVK